MKKFYAWYQKHITGAIFTGLILGILTGLLLADRFTPILTVTGVIGGIYMNALNMMIFPMVFCSIVMGICSIGNAKTTGKITGYSMIFFLCTTAIASAVGIIIPRLIRLGKGVHFEMATSDIQATEMTSILDTIKNLIPSNPVKAFAEGNMLQVLVFAVVVGFTLIAVGEKGQPLLNVIDSLNEVCLKVISTVMYFTPIGVFCTIVPVVEANGTKTIVSLASSGVDQAAGFPVEPERFADQRAQPKAGGQGEEHDRQRKTAHGQHGADVQAGTQKDNGEFQDLLRGEFDARRGCFVGLEKRIDGHADKQGDDRCANEVEPSAAFQRFQPLGDAGDAQCQRGSGDQGGDLL